MLHGIATSLSCPPKVTVDSNAQAFLVAAGVTSGVEVAAVNSLVVALKKAGIWSQLFFLYPFVGGSASSHSYNLVNPAFSQITWHGTVTHNAKGVTSDGTTGYGKWSWSGFGASAFGFMSNYQQSVPTPSTPSNSFSLGNDETYVSAYYDGSQHPSYAFNSTGRGFSTATALLGDSLVNRPAGTVSLYYKGVLDSSYTSPGDSVQTNLVGTVLVRQDNGTPGTPTGTGTVASVAAGNTGLTGGQITAWYSAIQAFQTALGRQV